MMRGRARHELLPAADTHSPTNPKGGKVTSVRRPLEQWPSGRVLMKWILYPELEASARF
jgi:hypothetical protein